MILIKCARTFDQDDFPAPKYRKCEIILVHITLYQIPGQHFFDIELLVKFVMRQSLGKKQPRSWGVSACPGKPLGGHALH